MGKYVAYQSKGRIEVCLAEHASYTPAGWVAPRERQIFDLVTGRLTERHDPARKVPATVGVPGLVTRSNNVRVVDDATQDEIDAIDAQIMALRRRRRAIVEERFLTFPLVQASDLKNIIGYPPVYPTKKEASLCGS